MSRNKPKYRDPLRTREAVPGTRNTKEGIQLLCPFCDPSHTLSPTEPSPCGTAIKVIAVQQIVAARVARHENLICIKCRQGGGEMVQFMSGFVHLEECSPGTTLLPEIPKSSRMAKIVFKMPSAIRKYAEKIFWPVRTVKEIDADGNETGNIVSYFFMKVKNGTSA